MQAYLRPKKDIKDRLILQGGALPPSEGEAMMKEKMFGSTAWRNEFFTMPPARNVKGRTKWTHRHAPWVEHLGRLAYVESRNEFVALTALEYLHRDKRIQRFKEQPFTTDPSVFGREYTPDFAAQVANQTYVIEIKTERFITRQLEAEFEKTKAIFSEHGMKFLVWTDKKPLIRPLRHNFVRLRRAAALNVEKEETARLLDMLAEREQLPLWALLEREFDLDLVAHACWNGKVFLPLREELHERTIVSLSPQESLYDFLFDTEPDIEAFWNSLGDAA